MAGICSCQKYTLPTNEDLEVVILQNDDDSSTPTVNVMSIHPVHLMMYKTATVLCQCWWNTYYTCKEGNGLTLSWSR